MPSSSVADSATGPRASGPTTRRWPSASPRSRRRDHSIAVDVAQRFLDWFASDPSDVGIQTRDVLSNATSAADVAVRGRALRPTPRCVRRQRQPDADRAGRPRAPRRRRRAHGRRQRDLGADPRRPGRRRGVRDLVHRDRSGRPRGSNRRRVGRRRSPARVVPAALGCVAARSRDEAADSVQPERLRRDRIASRMGGDPPDAAASEPRCVHFQRALHAAVRVGDDTDTVAAIAGSLLGARWGSTGRPDPMARPAARLAWLPSDRLDSPGRPHGEPRHGRRSRLAERRT